MSKTIPPRLPRGRAQLLRVLAASGDVIHISAVTKVLSVSRVEAAKRLARWREQGWVNRVGSGAYVPASIDTLGSERVLDDAWVLVPALFAPAYVAGRTAAEHWDLTEQIFRTTVVITQLTPRDRAPVIKGTNFLLCTVNEKKMFGLTTVWRDQIKVSVSDPTRTVLDLLADPRLGGGIRSVGDMLENYLRSEKKNLNLLIEYADKLDNGAVFKRLGFLLEQHDPTETSVIEQCAKRLTKGNTSIDPIQPAERLVSRWRLWVPAIWLKGVI